MLLLKYWKFALGSSVTLIACILLHNVRVNSLKASYALKIEKARQEEIQLCEREKKDANQVSQNYQSKINSLERERNYFRGLRDKAKCVPIVDSTR